MSGIRRLVDYPWVLVRVRREVCKRAGAYRLARLAVEQVARMSGASRDIRGIQHFAPLMRATAASRKEFVDV
jgi:hypothetical protein